MIALPTDQERETKLKELYAAKSALLEKYVVFGGGEDANLQHKLINRQLEVLGIQEDGSDTWEVIKGEIISTLKPEIFFTYYGSLYRYENEYGAFRDKVVSGNLHLDNHIRNTSSRLLLKDLSDISDEHAIEIARLIGLSSTLYTKYKVVREDNRVDVWFGYNCVHIYNDCSISSNSVNTFINMGTVADQLRGWGYAIPYKGVDLFKHGIATRKIPK